MKDRKNRKNGCRSINTISFLISNENPSGSIDKMKLCRDISQRVRKYRERKFFVELISKYNFAYLQFQSSVSSIFKCGQNFLEGCIELDEDERDFREKFSEKLGWLDENWCSCNKSNFHGYRGSECARRCLG